MSNSPGDRAPRLEQVRVPRHQVDAALHEHPRLSGCRGAAAPAPARGFATGDTRTDRRPRTCDRRRAAKSSQTESIDRSRTDRLCSCQIEQNEQRNGQPRAVSISHAGRCARQAYCRRQGATWRRAGSGTSSRTNVSGSAAVVDHARRSDRGASDRARHRACRRAPAHRRCAAPHARHRPGRRRRRSRRERARDTRRRCGRRRRSERRGRDRRTLRASARTSSVSSACMAAMPTSPGLAARSWCSSERLNRRSASVTAWPRASSAAAMYSMPRGSIRKKGPSPNRSLPGTGRSRRTCIGKGRSVTYTAG